MSNGLSTLIDRYDAFLLDLWGVVHDGSHLYPGVHQVIENLYAADKKIIFISNAPRRAQKIITVLSQLGIEPSLYDHAISSGEIGYQHLAAQLSVTPAQAGAQVAGMDSGRNLSRTPIRDRNDEKKWGRKYYYIGPAKDADILDGLPYLRHDDLKQADFLLNVGFGSEEQSSDDLMPLLRAAKAQGLPMLCLNPDLEVVKQTGEHFPCAGLLAKKYQQLSGEVTWFGKPYPEIYDWCMAQLPAIPKSRILAIGDSLETDIPGALNFGLDAMLITGGILKTRTPADIATLCKTLTLAPHFIAPSLTW